MKGCKVHLLVLSIALSFSSVFVRAQSGGTNAPVVSPQPPVVTVLASTPNASEDGPVPGVFQIARSGDTTDALTVYYALGGTARNGRDYQMLPSWVSIPPGAASASVTVTPILDRDQPPQTNDTVVLQLQRLIDNPLGRLHVYSLGVPSNAVVTITESTKPPQNQPPLVQWLSPGDGSGFVAPANLELVAQAQDADGTVRTVEFFNGTTSLGVVSNNLSGERFRSLYSLDVTNLPAGTYVLTAKATDDQGGTSTTTPVTVKVLAQAGIPTVTVAATTAAASELGPVPGVFTLTRTGDTSGSLAVYYSLAGTARNGVDYQQLGGVVNFAAGAATTNITVTPIPDLDPVPQTNDTVVLQLRTVHSPGANALGLYNIGAPSNAVVTITEDMTAFPVVTVTATDPNAAEDGPDPGTFQVTRTGNTAGQMVVYYSLGGSARNGRDYQMLPGSVTIPAGAASANITVTPILDYDMPRQTNDTVVLQLRPRVDLVRDGSALYSVGWPSNAVVTITESTSLPPNQPPVVRLLTPADGPGFLVGTNIQLLAQAYDPDGKVSNVQFFVDTTSLGTVTAPSGRGRDRGLYSLTWSNVTAGQYALTAVALDDQGAKSTSGPVHVVVTQTLLPAVSIVASDPIAVTGTNGPSNINTASFTVRRTDGTNADLVVYFTLSGTATNGTDYATVPNSVTIPAGRYTALITITPLASATANGARQQTVIATLQLPPTPVNTPPAYTLGRSQQAVAVIIDRPASRFGPGWLQDGIFHASVPAPAATSFRWEVSNDLTTWQSVGTNNAVGGSAQFVDPDSGQAPVRFYRAVPDSGAQSD